MSFQKRILSITAVLVIGALPAFAGQSSPGTATSSAKKATSSKASTPKIHTAQGSIVAVTDDLVTLRSGKKDMSFKISATTQKPTSITPGSNVTVNYHDEGNQHFASVIQLAPTKPNATAAKPPASR